MQRRHRQNADLVLGCLTAATHASRQPAGVTNGLLLCEAAVLLPRLQEWLGARQSTRS